MTEVTLTRKRFLVRLGGAAGVLATGAVLAACGGATAPASSAAASGAPASASSAPASPGSAAPSSPAAASASAASPAASPSGSVAGSAAASASVSPSAGGSAASSGGAPSSAGGGSIKVQIGVQNVEFTGDFEADKQGYLKAAGISQDLLAFGPNVQPITVVANGGALAGVIGGADSLLKARASGIPVVAIGTMYQKAPSGLLSLAKNPIKTPKDAVGKKIGLQSGARGPWSVILKLNGLKESDMTIVPVEFDPTPLVQGQVDGFWAFAFNQPLAIKAKGLDPYFMTAFDAGYKFYGDVIFTTEQAVRSQSDLLANWLRATIQGWEYTLQHPDEAAKLTVDRSPALNLDLQQQSAQLKAEADFLTSDFTKQKGLFWMQPEVWQAGIDILKDQNGLAKPITAAEVNNTAILEKAYRGATTIPLQ